MGRGGKLDIWRGLADWFALRERVAGHTALALVATFGGVAYMVWGEFGGGSGFGDLMALTVAGMFAVVIVTIRRFGDIDLLPAMVVAGLPRAALSLPLADPFSISLSDAEYLTLFGCGEFGLSLVLFTAGARLVATVEVAVGEEPGERALTGGAVVLGTLALYTVADWRRARVVPPLA
jgi:drug/metabolite transporter (DMT)-like permease